MIKVVIVEDEDIIRQGMVSAVDWQRFGMEVVGEADNGEDGLQLIREKRPEVIITDIRMPFLDGISMVEQVGEMGLDAAVIIISGYDEFAYAQRALKAGAHDYILKPLNMAKLGEVLQRLQEKVERERRTLLNLNKLDILERENRAYLTTEVLRSVVLGRPGQEEDAALIGARRELEEQYSHCVAGIVHMEDFTLRTIDLGYLELLELDQDFGRQVEGLVEGLAGCRVLESQPGERLVCLLGGAGEEVDRAVRKVRERLRPDRQRMASVTAAFGSVKEELEGLRQSYREAVSAMDARFLGPDQTVLQYAGSAKEDAPGAYINFDDSRLLMHIRSGDKERINEEIGELADAMRENGVVSHLHTVLVISGVYFNVLKLPGEVGGSAEEALINPLDSFNTMLRQQSLEQVMEAFGGICHKIADYLIAYSSGRYADVLRRAKEYIASSFTNEGLLLEEVAQHTYISSSYLSVIFKQETGETFIEYLTRLRMEHAAKLLLEGNLKTYEVAEASGYGNPTYFSTVFKKYYKCTPSEFRNNRGR